MPVFLRWFLRLGITNPITVRLVQNGSRRVRHMYIRAAYLAVLIVVLLWSLLLGTSGSSLSYRELASAGAGSFINIAYLQIGLICILAPVFMAGAIAQEASPQTWEVLLTTPLTATQIVLGNLFGRLFFILALLVASLPLFALTQFFGGVPGSSIFISTLIAACAALVVGATAIALSVSRLVGKRAVFAFYVSVISYLALTIGLDQFFAGRTPGVRVTYMTALNPFLALYSLLNPSTYNAAPPGTFRGPIAWLLETPVKTWCVGSTLLSLFLIVVSTFTVRFGGIGQLGVESTGIPWWRRLFGLDAAGAEHRAPRAVWTNPIAWREAAARNATTGKILARWTFIALGGLFGISLVVLYHTAYLNTLDFRRAIMYTVFGEVAVSTLVAINMAATAVSREREDGTLDLLLTTPITPSQYLQGKLRGLIAYLLPLLAVPIGTLGIAGLYTLFNGLERAGGVTVTKTINGVANQIPAVLPEAGLIAPLVVIPFIAACVMVGLQSSLKSKGTIGSVVATVGVVGVVAGIVGLCGWKAAESLPYLGPVIGSLSPATGLYSLVFPEDALEATISNGGFPWARLCLGIGGIVATLVFAAFVYGSNANMVRTFDVTTRKLAGNK